MAVFQLNSFCSKIPDEILQTVFGRFEIDDVDCKLLRSDKWLDEWARLDKKYEPETISKLLALLQQTNDFRGDKAQIALQDAAELYLSESVFAKFRSDCLSLENIQSRLLKAWLKNDEIFERACALYVIDSISQNGWRLRTGIGNHKVNTSKEALQNLSKEIQAVLGKQMRAQFCESRDVGLRGESRIIRSQISDYSETSEEWDKGEFKGRPRTPARALIFDYNAKRGTLNVTTQGCGRVGYRLHEAFCRAILGMEELPNERPVPTYRIQHLLKRKPEFFIDPRSVIKGCSVVGMKLRDSRFNKIVTINLTAQDARDGYSTKVIYEQLNSLFNDALQQQVELCAVVLKFQLKIKYGPKTFEKIRISETETHHIDLGEADDAIHAFLIENGLEEPPDENKNASNAEK